MRCKRERREADLERGREACIVELSCILEGSALGRKGLMHVLHMNMYVSCILEGSALGRKGFMSVLSMDMCVILL